MRFYFNPCFSRFSFNKEEEEDQENYSNKRMNHKDRNFNQSCERSSSSSSSNEHNGLTSVKLNHAETFDMDDVTYRPEESLTEEYRGHINENNDEKKRKKFILCGIASVIILLIIAGVIAYVAVVVINGQRSSSTCKGDNCNTTTGKSIKDNKVDLSNSNNNNNNKNNEVEKVDKNSNKVCTTKRCQYIANNLKNSMNFTVDPCDNFHEYVCGIWDQTHPLPASMPKLDTMGLLNLNKNKYLKNMIENELSKKSHGKGFKSKILKFYKSCKNLDQIDKKGKQPLMDFIAEFGTWSPIKGWVDSKMPKHDITSLLVKSHQYFTASVYDDRVNSPLFKAIVKVNDVNSSQHILEINIPDLPIADPTIYTLQNARAKEIRSKYKLLQTNYVALLGPERDAEKVLENLMKFEIELANITIEASFIRNVMQQYNLTNIRNLTKAVGTEIDWLKLMRGYFAPVKGVKVTENTYIGVRSINFFKALNAFIARTEEQLVKDYIIWVIVWKFGSYVSAPYREAHYNFQKAIIGIQERPEQWKTCITDIEQTMEFGLANMYVQQALNDNDKKLATQIVKNITNEFSRNLVNVEWMDVATKAKAFEKVNSIAKNIGYPDYVKNETYLNIYYKKVHIHDNSYFQNLLTMYKEKKIANLILIDKLVDRTAYDLPPTLVEAYFDPNKNKMVFLAGILHVPFFDTEGPMALNYGALGLVVGHEVTHAFDDIGRQFDGNGEKRNWWTDRSSKAFSKRSDCMVNQYSSYSMYGINVDGRLTLGENIADNGGIKVAYMAYKQWERVHGKEKRLPGIPLTMDQLLFVSHGQVWCGAYREEYVKRALKIDYHSPAKYRIIGPLSNLKEFSDAFKCPLGSTMNPHKKCRVW